MKFIFFINIFFLCIAIHAADMECSLYKVVDGDTFKCNFEGLPEIFGRELSIRIKDCDSPEIRTKDPHEKELGHIAKTKLEKMLTGRKILLKNVERGKYFRLVADVFADGQQVTCPESKLVKAPEPFKCGTKWRCSQMTSCEEAYFYYKNCGVTKLDKDKDGIPCESICR